VAGAEPGAPIPLFSTDDTTGAAVAGIGPPVSAFPTDSASFVPSEGGTAGLVSESFPDAARHDVGASPRRLP
jgi:hypothetical protein